MRPTLRHATCAGVLVGLAVLSACGRGEEARPVLPAPRAEIELFTRPGCSHCAEAKTYVDALLLERPTLSVLVVDVIADADARERLAQISQAAGARQMGTPSFYVHGHLLVGWRGEDTRRLVERVLDHAATLPPDATGAVCPVDPDLPACVEGGATSSEDELIHLPLFGPVRPRDVGLPLFTVLIGLVDGFNPCAMWVLLFLLGLLVNLKSRKKMLVIAGTFVLASGAVYFTFMAAWLHVHRWIGWYRGVQVALGCLAIVIGALHAKDAFVFGKGPSVGIPEAVKPGIYERVRRILLAHSLGAAMASVIALALMVNLVELLCTAGLPAVYTHVLARHDLTLPQQYGYMALYQVFYMLDDAFMLLLAVVTLNRARLQERGARVLKLVSGIVMLAMGLTLVFRPELLAW